MKRKRSALRVARMLATVWLGALSSCALAPTHVGAAATGSPHATRPQEEALESPAASQTDVLLGTDVGNVRLQPHLVPLPVAGHPDAVLALPFDLSGGRPRPVVVVLHGLGDHPEPHCEAWRNIVSANAFVVCPRGGLDAERSAPGSPRYTHPGGVPLREHVNAVLAALASAYGEHVDTTRPLLAGFSLGATEAALLAQSDPERFPRVAVLEGGLDVWIGPTIRAYAVQGGRRVLFGCGSPWCTPPARADVERIDRGGAGRVGARIAFADVGHRPAPALQAAVKGAFPWFVAGDPRFSPPDW